MRKFASYLIPALVLACVLAFQYYYPEQIEDFRIKVFDIFQKIKPRAYQPTPVRIIDIDDASLTKLGQWPWPRTLLAKLVSRLAQGGARVIAFDAIFAEPDRTSPQNVIPLWPENPSTDLVRSQMDKIPDHDAIFAEAIAKAPVVLAFAPTPGKVNSQMPALKCGVPAESNVSGDKAIDYLQPSYNGAVMDLPVLEKAAAGNGSIAMPDDRDNIIRRLPLFFNLRQTLYPSLVAEALRVAQGVTTYKIKLGGGSGEWAFGEKTGIVKARTGKLTIPTDKHGRVWLYDTGDEPERYIPAWKVLSDDFDLASLKGTLLFVGTSATGLKDLRSTPLNPRTPGVEIHAEIAEQVILQNFLERPDWAEGAEFSYLVLLGLILILLLPRAGAVLCALIGIMAVALAMGLSWYAFDRHHLLTDPVFPSLVIFLIYLVSSFLNFLRTEREKSQIRGAFSRYLSPLMVERLAKNPTQLRLGGEMRTMTFLFTDIRNFTGLAEQMKPEELTQFMNSFLTPMTDIILKNRGTIDKYMGDCIMAFWNAPFEDPEHARHACLAALGIQDFLKEWNKTLESEALRDGKVFNFIRVGIGINTGNACVGNMGSEQRFDYTVLGDDVNLASRLEGASKNYGMTTILGPNTAAGVPENAALEVDLIRVKGKKIPVKIFALLGDKELSERAIFKELQQEQTQILAAYRDKRWEEAERLIENCRKVKLPDIELEALYDLYMSRIQYYRANPPDPSWDGVTIATSK